MDAMNSLDNNNFDSLLQQVRKDFPLVTFVSGERFMWSLEDMTISYDKTQDYPMWSLLHELGHMIHKHAFYKTDMRLIHIELEAWTAAQEIAKRYNIVIDKDHIEDCMDSYRDWQQRRSTCPVCTQNGLEIENHLYHCINCQHRWQVGKDRFCRVYRLATKTAP